MKTRGSQNREHIEETEYKIKHIDEHIIVGVEGHYKGEWPERREAILENDGEQELWMENNDFAGYVLVIDGMGFEFIRSILK